MNATTLDKAYGALQSLTKVLSFEEYQAIKDCLDYADDAYVAAAEEAATAFILGSDQCSCCESYSKESCLDCMFNPHNSSKKDE